MRFKTTPAFDRDFKRLPQAHRDKFRTFVAPGFNDAATRAASGEADPWPKGMRVKAVKGALGVWELTWSMNDPDGRATWEWTKIDGEAAIQWRRVGDHAIFENA